MAKVIKTVNIDKEHSDIFDYLGINFSLWVRNKIEQEFMTEEGMKKLVKDKKREIRYLKALKDSKFRKMSEVEISELRRIKQIVVNSPELIPGNIRYFSNMFGRPLYSKIEFLKLLESV